MTSQAALSCNEIYKNDYVLNTQIDCIWQWLRIARWNRKTQHSSVMTTLPFMTERVCVCYVCARIGMPSLSHAP